MFCKWCACPNLPKEFECVNCGEELQSGDAAEIALKRWEELPEEARAEFEEKFKADQEHFRKGRSFYTKNLWKDSIIGGITLGIIGFAHGYIIISDVILGGLAGCLLNANKGGGYLGIFLFGGAYVVSFMFKWVFGLSYGNPFMGEVSVYYLPILTMGQLMSLALGLAYGLKIDRDYVDRA